ncbi:hypothetical protein GLOTRDRAFT_38471, partial [Gloeophyllum trabeum ATCC 11539]
TSVPFGVTYEKIGTIQRRLAWPLHKDDTLTQSGSSTELNIFDLFSGQHPLCKCGNNLLWRSFMPAVSQVPHLHLQVLQL